MLLHLHPLAAVPIWHRLRRLGGPGLVLLGIADNSVIPLTGSMDVLTIWLAARHLHPWPFYAAMATLGAVLGGYITYAVARKGGKETMERKLSKRRAKQVSKAFERWGFFAVAIPALMPPPFPFLPFLLAAGAMQYSPKKFLGSLTLGRGVRYSIGAYLGFHYGRHILRFFNQYYKPAMAILIGLAVIGAIMSLVQYLRLRKK
ncbi:MAG TPA: VTT domain-containing protein [Candidatus Dormibacteraeota bacterium]|jgi:membrane protein YqaA with SNARE-associated domain|nr:VTT domain-containing protein [Candidatus Dormibacteraeota bacterium]